MPKQVKPDWRVILTKTPVRKAVLTGKETKRLARRDKPIAERLHRYISRDDRGNPLSKEERLRRIDNLSARQLAASRYILADRIATLIKTEISFQLLNGETADFSTFVEPIHIYRALEPLRIGPRIRSMTDETLQDRPDLAVKHTERVATLSEALATDARRFPNVRNRKIWAETATKNWNLTKELRAQPAYGGYGRRPKLNAEHVRQFVGRLVEWLEARPGLTHVKHSAAKSLSCSELLDAAKATAEEIGCSLEPVAPDDVIRIVFAGGKTTIKSRVVRLAALAFGAAESHIRKLLKTGR